jgi:hypothetical protein
MSNYLTIHHSEITDFESECVRLGLKSTDFKLIEHSIIETESTEGLIRKNAVVDIQKNNKTIASYRTGSGSHWVVDFINDLESGKVK